MTFKKPKILIVGIDSMIAQNLISNPILNNFDIYGTTRRVWNHKDNQKLLHLDLASDKINLLQESFDFAVICAGETNIKNCQNFYDKAKQINVDNTIYLISNLISNGTFVLFLSSNAVFDGSKPFCKPTDLTNPINNYGKFKLEVENYLANQKVPSSILRLTKVVAPNFGILAEWSKSLANNIEINAYTDLLISPIELEEATESIISIINLRSTGIFHLGGKVEMSYYEFAMDQFKNVLGVSELVKPVTSSLKYQGKYNSLRTYLP
jgi:dTDP-4-dehydrorhamnose reductase